MASVEYFSFKYLSELQVKPFGPYKYEWII